MCVIDVTVVCDSITLSVTRIIQKAAGSFFFKKCWKYTWG